MATGESAHDRSVWSLTGPDAIAFLQGLVSNDLRPLERDPGIVQRQTDLAASYGKLSLLDTPALPKAERRALLQQGLALLEGLQQRGQLPPGKQTWPDMFRQMLLELN